MNPTFATIIFALAASLFWGSGSFSGGLVSRRDNTSNIVLASSIVGVSNPHVKLLLPQA